MLHANDDNLKLLLQNISWIEMIMKSMKYKFQTIAYCD